MNSTVKRHFATTVTAIIIGLSIMLASPLSAAAGGGGGGAGGIFAHHIRIVLSYIK